MPSLVREEIWKLAEELTEDKRFFAQDRASELKSLVREVRHLWCLRIMSMSYDIPEEYVKDVINDYMTNTARDFLSLWTEKLIGRDFASAYADYDFTEKGEYTGFLGVLELYRYETHDGGRVDMVARAEDFGADSAWSLGLNVNDAGETTKQAFMVWNILRDPTLRDEYSLGDILSLQFEVPEDPFYKFKGEVDKLG